MSRIITPEVLLLSIAAYHRESVPEEPPEPLPERERDEQPVREDAD